MKHNSTRLGLTDVSQILLFLGFLNNYKIGIFLSIYYSNNHIFQLQGVVYLVRHGAREGGWSGKRDIV